MNYSKHSKPVSRRRNQCPRRVGERKRQPLSAKADSLSLPTSPREARDVWLVDNSPASRLAAKFTGGYPDVEDFTEETVTSSNLIPSVVKVLNCCSITGVP
jgi:hypothetical protein